MFASNITALLATAVPIAVEPISKALSSPTTAVIPSNAFNSAAVDVTPSSIFNSAPVDVIVVPPKLIASAANVSIFAVPSINKSLNSREEVPKSISLSVIGTIAPSCILNCCTAAEDTST